MWRSTLNRPSRWLVCAVFLSLAVGADALAQDGTGALEAGGAELALVPVGSSAPHMINGNEITIPSVRATVELEIRASGLQESGEVCVSAYRAKVDSNGYSSALSGTLTPVEFSCKSDGDCFAESICQNNVCDARSAAYIDRQRPDYIFANVPDIATVYVSTLDFTYAAIMLLVGTCNARDSGYCGTLSLQIPEDASGTFIVGIKSGPDTEVEDWFGQSILPLSLIPALITISPPICGNLMCEVNENEQNCPLDCVEHGLPTVSIWGIAIMALFFLILAKISQRRWGRHGNLGVAFILAATFSVVITSGAALAQDGTGAVEVGGAELALVPVGSSAPHVINGNEITIPSVGATVELEIRASGLQKNETRCLVAYAAQIDSSGYSSGSSGTLTPAQIPCVSDVDCFGTSQCEGGVCDLGSVAYIDPDRADFLFNGLPGIRSVDRDTLDYRYSFSMFAIGTCNARDSGHAGTLILEVPPGAAGVFTVGFLPFPDSGVAYSPSQVIDPLALRPALIVVTPPACGNFTCEVGEDERNCPLDCVEHGLPTVSMWGIAIMALFFLTLAKISQRRWGRQGNLGVAFILAAIFGVVITSGAALGQDGGGAVEAGGAELALVPVGSSGPHVINGNEITIPSVGATVELEIRGSGFQKDQVRCLLGYGATIESSGYTTGLSGTLTPARITCDTDDDCFAESVCAGGVCDVRGAAYIDRERSDYFFAGFHNLFAVDVSTLNFIYAATILDVGCVDPDSWYGGTLILEVPQDARGTFTVGFRPHPDSVVIDNLNRYVPLKLVAGLITIMPPFCGNLVCEVNENERNCPLDCLEHGLPAVSMWGMAIMVLLLLTVARICWRRRAGRSLPMEGGATWSSKLRHP